ncbi:MAG: hypothetical protein JWQ71_4702 [Pedosphaera sp.]|nr:hypothetical protein [Pedosphaera sp.]
MKKTTGKISYILTLLTFGLFSSSFGQGSLTPPGAPAPTMKSLDQIEARTIITSLPYVITNAGSYYLTGNLTGVAGTNGITIIVDNVSIDLNGFSYTGDGIYDPSNGIILNNNLYSNGGFNNLNNNIHATGSYNRIEGNHATISYTGIRVDSVGNVIIKNSSGGNSVANYNVAANNLFGPTLNSAATMATNSNPHANYTF